MKNPIQYIRQSLSRKLSLWIVLFAAIIFNVALGVMFRQSLDAVRQEAVNRATQVLDNTVLRVNTILQRVEKAADNTEWLILRHLNAPDSMFVYSRTILKNNPELNGCSIAFEPWYFKDRGKYFSAYSYNDNGSILTTQEGNDHYEYFYMDWYQMVKLLDRPNWTEPFFDFNLEDIYSKDMIASYCRPLKDANGSYIGTFSTDISLGWLSETISAVKPYPNSYSIMIGEGGTFFVHPDTTKLFYQTIFTETLEQPDPDLTALGHAMLRGEEGMHQLRMDGEDCYVFYKPLGNTGWSVAIVCPEDDIFGGYFRLQRIVLFIVIIGLILMLLVFSRIVSRELKPLRRLADQTGTIAKGHFDQKLQEDGRTDEIGRLSHSFGDMQQSLIRYIDELKETTARNASIESELKVASTIQASMLPRVFPPFPERKDIDLYASMIPAKEVGGDLFDFFLRDEKLFFCIGDVSGKGAPSAMLMAVTHALFRSASAHQSDPSSIMQAVNETTCQGNESNMFITLFLGVLNLSTGCLCYCNAGHDCPLILGIEAATALKAQPNLPLGVFADMKYEEQEIQLAPGSTVFLYTDGLTEAKNRDRKQFGWQRMADILSSCARQQLTPRQILETISGEVDRFVAGAEHSDDLTMLAIHYTPNPVDSILSESLLLKNDVREVARLGAFVKSVAERLNLAQPLAGQLRLAVEESVVNVIDYAYPAGSDGDITVSVVADGSSIKVTVIDSGIPFDPTSTDKADTSLSAEDRPIGGLGIQLVRELMDSVGYERTDGHNVLTLIKQLKR